VRSPRPGEGRVTAVGHGSGWERVGKGLTASSPERRRDLMGLSSGGEARRMSKERLRTSHRMIEPSSLPLMSCGDGQGQRVSTSVGAYCHNGERAV
jgi:hypothetical protein